MASVEGILVEVEFFLGRRIHQSAVEIIGAPKDPEALADMVDAGAGRDFLETDLGERRAGVQRQERASRSGAEDVRVARSTRRSAIPRVGEDIATHVLDRSGPCAFSGDN